MKKGLYARHRFWLGVKAYRHVERPAKHDNAADGPYYDAIIL